MDNITEQRIANLLAAVDLMEFAIMLMRQNIVRHLPEAGGAIIEGELKRWLIEQPRYFVPCVNAEGASS